MPRQVKLIFAGDVEKFPEGGIPSFSTQDPIIVIKEIKKRPVVFIFESIERVRPPAPPPQLQQYQDEQYPDQYQQPQYQQPVYSQQQPQQRPGAAPVIRDPRYQQDPRYGSQQQYQGQPPPARKAPATPKRTLGSSLKKLRPQQAPASYQQTPPVEEPQYQEDDQSIDTMQQPTQPPPRRGYSGGLLDANQQEEDAAEPTSEDEQPQG